MRGTSNLATKRKITIFISLMLGLALASFHQIGYSRNNCGDLFCPEEQIVLPGNYFQAVSVAAKDFQAVLKQNNHDKKSELDLFLLDLKNYLILISIESDGNFLIHFHPKNFQDSPIKGGGASYKVSTVTYKILEKEYTM
jgi:hypothetical protein